MEKTAETTTTTAQEIIAHLDKLKSAFLVSQWQIFIPYLKEYLTVLSQITIVPDVYLRVFARQICVLDFHSDHELHSSFFAISRMLRLLRTWRTLASDSRPGQAFVRHA